jgi:hypothetical protein
MLEAANAIATFYAVGVINQLRKLFTKTLNQMNLILALVL